MRPLKGKVEGKNTGKNILVRSCPDRRGRCHASWARQSEPAVKGVGCSRERVSNNIGEAGDEQVSKIAVTQHIVVTIPADIPIYIVLEKTPKQRRSDTRRRTQRSADDLPSAKSCGSSYNCSAS